MHWRTTLLFIALQKPLAAAPAQFLQLLFLQLSVAVLVGLPTYQLALDLLGKLAGHLSLHKIQVSLKSKIMLLGGLVPLLSYSVLMNYHWQQTGSLTYGILPSVSLVVTGMITLFSIRSVTKAGAGSGYLPAQWRIDARRPGAPESPVDGRNRLHNPDPRQAVPTPR
jgi:hypothetical protein